MIPPEEILLPIKEFLSKYWVVLLMVAVVIGAAMVSAL